MRTFVPRWSARFSSDSPGEHADRTDKSAPLEDSDGSVGPSAELVGADLTDATNEWRVAGCPGFSIAREALGDPELSACVRCGAGLHLHGHPPPDAWHVVDDEEIVELIAVRFVLAKAQAIAKGEG